MKVIETEHLSKYYGKAKGIDDVNLSVEEGDFYGFIGPNGAGKSTTIRTLLGFIKAASGRGAVFGKDISQFSVDIRQNVGYLPSETDFYKGMKVRDIIALSAKLRKRDCKAEAKLLCERLSLDIDKKADQLSFGNRKKLGIVCALQHRPSLYILDEPTSGLDPLMQKEFFDLLKERNRDGATVFLSSHVLSEIQKHCQKAAIIRQGKIVAEGNVESLSKANAKRVTIHGVSDFPTLEGIKYLSHEVDHISFLYSGQLKLLLKELSSMELSDVTISEPDLEEVFMHFYEKEGK